MNGNEPKLLTNAEGTTRRCVNSMCRKTRTASRKLVVRDTVLNVQVPLSGGYDFAREVSAPERPVRRFGDNPRTVQPPLRLTGRQIATS
jgi:hypothetical protein